MKDTQSLTATVTFISASVIAAAMLVYAVFQYAAAPNMPLLHLLFEHALHVLVLGVLSYVTLHLLLQTRVVKPVHQLCDAFRKISRGDDAEVSVDTNVTEIREIVDGVNVMLSQLRETSHEPWVDKLRDSAAQLRTLSEKRADRLEQRDRTVLGSVASELEGLAMMFERFEARVQNLHHEVL